MKKFFYTWAFGLLFPLAASAQVLTSDPVDAELFKPAIGGGIFGVDRAQVLEHGKVYFGAFLNYARNPLVVFTEQNGEVFLVPVRDQSALDIVASIGIRDRLEFGFAIPAGLYMSGDDLNGQARADGEVQSGRLGDARLNGKLNLLRKLEDPAENGPRLALQVEVKLPTGQFANPSNSDSFFSDKSGAVAMVALGDVKKDKLTLTGNFGVRLRSGSDVNIQNVTVRNELVLGGGLGYQASDAVLLGAEVDALANIEQNNFGSTPAELRLGAKLGGGRVQIPIGVGAGLNNSFSAPDFRVFAGLTFLGQDDADPDNDGINTKNDSCPKIPEDFDSFEDEDGCPDDDNDSDGLADISDLCPNSPEDYDSFDDKDGCPDLDNDKDNIADTIDTCPNLAEDFDKFEDGDGCPDLDNDKDGIADIDDVCPMIAGIAALRGCMDTDGDKIVDGSDMCPNQVEDYDGFQDADGCPDLDNDGDGFADLLDYCPDQAEDKNGTRDDDGCPDEVYAVIYCGKIVILDRIFFDTNKTTIKAVSNPVLDAVIKVLKEHPEVTKVRVEGNADDVGTKKKNQILSEGRANVVVAYLVAGGIDPNRLQARGNTESNPMTSVKNLDPKAKEMVDARDQNRRVEFVVVTE